MDRLLKEPPAKSGASEQLSENFERLLWYAHQRAAEILDAEPGVVSQIIFDVIHAEWRRAFVGTKR